MIRLQTDYELNFRQKFVHWCYFITFLIFLRYAVPKDYVESQNICCVCLSLRFSPLYRHLSLHPTSDRRLNHIKTFSHCVSAEPALTLTTSRVSNKCILSEKMACQVERWLNWDMVGQDDRPMLWPSAEEMLHISITGTGAGLFSCGLGCPIHRGEVSHLA